MTKPLSIIVPVLNEGRIIGPFLDHLLDLEGSSDTEIIVVDGGSIDNSREVGAQYPVTLINSPRGRSRQMNAGAARAKGSSLFFVHADSQLPADAIERVIASLRASDCAGSFRLAFQSRNWLLRMFAWFTRFELSLFRFGDQGLFVSRRLFQQAGGFDETLLLMEDQDIVRRLRKLAPFKVLPKAIRTSARKYVRHGVLYTQLTFTLILIFYYLGASQHFLAGLYQGAFSNTAEGNQAH